jgi:hypothetical protein
VGRSSELPPACARAPTGNHEDWRQSKLVARSLLRWEKEHHSRPRTLFGIPSATAGEPVRQYSVAPELFPTERLGVRVGYSQPDGDFDVDSYDVGATWFFRRRIAVQFTLSRVSNDDAPPGLGRSESAGVRFIGRL